MKFRDNYFAINHKIHDLVANVDIDKLYNISKEIIRIKENKKKLIIVGNGGSHAIAEHISTDISRTLSLPALSFSSTSLNTCFANDYEYQNAVSKYIQNFSNSGDLIILISSSGESENMINGANTAKKLNLKLVTLTGFEIDNRLSSLGDINIQIPIKHYNIVENSHQIILTTILDIINQNIIPMDLNYPKK